METPLLEIVGFYYSELPPRYEIPLHLHHFYQLDVVLEGRRSVAWDDRVFDVDSAGDAWLIPPLVRHGYATDAGYRHMLFQFHLAPSHWPLFGTGRVRFRVSPSLLEKIENTGSRCSQNAPLIREQVAAAAVFCLIECLDQKKDETPPDKLDEFRRRLWPLLTLVEYAPYDEWTVEDMAARCHLSPTHFSRCFARVTSKSPHRYVLETRMRAVSVELLDDPNRPIKEIADRAGYGTVQSFARAFKRVFAMAPAAYRKLPREGDDQ